MTRAVTFLKATLLVVSSLGGGSGSAAATELFTPGDVAAAEQLVGDAAAAARIPPVAQASRGVPVPALLPETDEAFFERQAKPVLHGVAPQVVVPAVFTFKTTFDAKGDRLILGEIAECAGEQVICEEAYGVDLGPAPEPGRTVHLGKAKLKEMLGREWDQSAIEIVAPEGLKLTSGAAIVDEQIVADALRAKLASELGSDAAAALRVEVERVTLPVKPRVRSGSYRVLFPSLDAAHTQNVETLARRLNGPQRLEARFVSEDRDTAGTPAAPATFIQAVFTLQRKLPVLAHDLARGDIVTAADLSEAWLPQGRGILKVASTPREIIGRRVKRDLPALEAIPLVQLEIPLAVRKGQIVRLVMRAGELNVTGQVKTLAAGAYGQTIEALYPATKKKLRVRVVDATTVEYLR